MSGAWDEMHGAVVEEKPAAKVDALKTDDDWQVLWKERCAMKWALLEIEQFAQMKGDFAVARMARRALIGKVAFENELHP